VQRTPDENGAIYVLEHAVALDLHGELCCDWRDATSRIGGSPARGASRSAERPAAPDIDPTAVIDLAKGGPPGDRRARGIAPRLPRGPGAT